MGWLHILVLSQVKSPGLKSWRSLERRGRQKKNSRQGFLGCIMEVHHARAPCKCIVQVHCTSALTSVHHCTTGWRFYSSEQRQKLGL